jgi:hypothetical protein
LLCLGVGIDVDETGDPLVTDVKCNVVPTDADLVVPVERIDDICVIMFVLDIVLCIVVGKVVVPIDFSEIGEFELFNFSEIGEFVLPSFVEIGEFVLLGFVEIGEFELFDFSEIGEFVLLGFVEIGEFVLLGFVVISKYVLLNLVNMIFFNSVCVANLDVFVLFLNFIS